MTLESKIEAILFWKAEPMTIGKLSSILDMSKEEIKEAVNKLGQSLEGRGLSLVVNGDEIELRTSADTSTLIEKLTKEELLRDLGKAGLETISIILYKHPIKRSEVDYIRGVNSSFILRNLLIRGLIERMSEKETEGRGYSYKPTLELLSHLGVSRIEDLPDYASVKADIENFEASESEIPRSSEQVSETASTENK